MRTASKALRIIVEERRKQERTIDLIPSENIASPAVLGALGSVFTNKYAEGYPERRYYPGNRLSDRLELHTQELVRKLFQLDDSYAVNVQPYSGSPANLAVYLGLLDLGDPLMGLELSHGGHLTHGHRVSLSGKLFNSIRYFVDPASGLIDYEQVEEMARRSGPKIIVSGATAYPRRLDFERFHRIAKTVSAYSLADISHLAGLVAAGVHPSPFPFTDVVTFTTHKTLRGPRGAVIVAKRELAERIDRVVFPGLQGGPHLNTIAAMAVCFEEALKPAFGRYVQQVVRNAAALGDRLLALGYTLVSGGTDTHLLLLDLRPRGVAGKDAEMTLEEAGIIANRNTVPGDEKPLYPSGIRLGTPTVTTRGMREREMALIATWMDQVLAGKRSGHLLRRDVEGLCRRFPLPY